MGEDSSGIASYSAVLIPVHNEAATLAFVLDSVRGHFGGPVLVIDDGSTDSTSQILSCFEWVDVIRHSNNLGYGKALATAFAWAAEKGLDSVVTMDCDGQHEPARIPEFLAELSQGADIISGSRYLPESVATGEAPTSRQEINAKVTAVINDRTGWSLSDAFCGFKAYRMASIAGVEWQESGYGFPLELWARAYARHLSVREMPVARIYCDRTRSFGAVLDNPEVRYDYYMRVWNATLSEEGIQ
ncbi:MAG: glycosyltransferase family 2 protein [Actinobacteria bacterium]|nr:glycosyltransferase family 2 protein [Actinomycetota bacterium]MCL5888260.1 glycosyltransferase family 2 protein [Actinomycetota bacterium]